MKACCVTGHRNLADEKIYFVTSRLGKEIENAVADGFILFISGFAPGTDMIFARLIVNLLKDNPQIHLEAALPYGTWFKNRSIEDKGILLKCVGIGIHSAKYHPNCFLIRNHYMINACERVIAVYDGREKGGSVNTIKYAMTIKRDIRMIQI